MNVQLPPTFQVADQPEQAQLEAFLDEHRDALAGSLDGLSEEQARRAVVPSGTTLLGLVKHGAYVEKVWFDQAFTGRSRTEIGIPENAPDSFVLTAEDTIASILSAYAAARADSKTAATTRSLDEVLTGSPRGEFPLRWIYLHMIREVAEHCGHADILREIILAE